MAVTAGTWNLPFLGGNLGVLDLGITEKLGIATNPNQSQATKGGLDYSRTGQDLPSGVETEAKQLPNEIAPTYHQIIGPQPVSGIPINQPIRETNPVIQRTNPGVDWSKGLTGEQVRGLGMNPDAMTATNGLYYNANSGSGGNGVSDAELNSAYDPIFQYLNQAEQSVRGGYGGVQQDINSQYGVSQGTLDTSKQQGLSSLGTNEQKVQQTKEDAMSAARRLYNELIQGYGQRFGGSTSAGEAARVLAGNEAQRTMGGVNRDYSNNIAAIQQKKVEVEQNYNNQLMQLQSTRDQALNQANRDFQQKLLDISNTRASTASEKAQQKLSALQELRNQAYNIQLQNQQFAQQLALQKQADSSNIDSYMSQISQATGAGNSIQSGYNPQVASNLQVGNSNVGGQSALTGRVGNNKEELYQGYAPADERLATRLFGVPRQ